ncbi:glycosyl hydrolase [Candidatus Colwellia aromaticivorans]|uniref:glycosyl hydrolase n=1 Tax=Candidatus Colwellia aromaticivorans TaxID=2267621 RepID=UPI000DF4B3E6|nr:glycosyl hydrolase [Candidatus Colwellia aromaticivorans]
MITSNTSINPNFQSVTTSNSRTVYIIFLNRAMLILALLLIPLVQAGEKFKQYSDSLLQGETIAVAYSGFRVGQHPDRGEGAINPSDTQILEDLNILLSHDLNLIRLYDSGENSAMTLKIIKQNKLPIKVLLGMWLEAEVSNHEGCAWLELPIPESELSANKLSNMREIQRGIKLSKNYSDIVIAVNVGNEALVDWNDHMVTLNSIISYVRQVKQSISQPVTVADNYEWWIRDGAPLAAEVDFIGVHTYPAWEGKTIAQALAYTIENIENVHQALPNKPITILEGGWATTGKEFAKQASEANQKRYFNDIKKWAKKTNTTFFFFEAFDEPWKGNPDNLDGAEKHWGLFNVDRSPKKVLGK